MTDIKKLLEEIEKVASDGERAVEDGKAFLEAHKEKNRKILDYKPENER